MHVTSHQIATFGEVVVHPHCRAPSGAGFFPPRVDLMPMNPTNGPTLSFSVDELLMLRAALDHVLMPAVQAQRAFEIDAAADRRAETK
jgi:hypothetical protein